MLSKLDSAPPWEDEIFRSITDGRKSQESLRVYGSREGLCFSALLFFSIFPKHHLLPSSYLLLSHCPVQGAVSHTKQVPPKYAFRSKLEIFK